MTFDAVPNRIKIFDARMVLVPHNASGMHWRLIAVDIQNEVRALNV